MHIGKIWTGWFSSWCFWFSATSSPGSVITASGQGQMTNLKLLERGDDWQHASVEDWEGDPRARNEIHQIIDSVIYCYFFYPAHYQYTTASAATSTMPSTTVSATKTAVMSTMPSTTASATMMPTMTDYNGPGWRRIAFINMTAISYNSYCPIGFNLTSYSKRTCGRLYKTWGGCFSTTLIQCWRFTIQPYMWEDKGIPVGGD